MNFLLENRIASLDFNPNGETVATMDLHGTCLLSDMNTSNYSFHLNMEISNHFGFGKQCLPISIFQCSHSLSP